MFREKLEIKTGYSSDEIDRIMEMASNHPDDNDIKHLCEFAQAVAGVR